MSGVLATFVAVLLAIQSAPAQQQADTRTWYAAYADALKDIQDRNWQKAIADLAVASQRGAPKPGRNVLLYGALRDDYNPDYYLGLAYMNLQRFGEADGAFERVRQAQLISAKDSLYAEFTRQATMAKDILQKQAAQVRQTVQSAAAGQNPNVTQSAPNVAQTAPNTQNAQAARPPAANAAPNALNPQARANAAMRSVVPPAPPPTVAAPPDERTGILQFFSGDYEAAAASLAAITYSPGAPPRAYFYLACARAALVLTGKAPKSAMDDARTQLALAKDNGQFAADKRLISPRIKQELGMQP